MSELKFDDIAEIFKKNQVACGGKVTCTTDDWNKIAQYIEQFEKEKADLVEFVTSLQLDVSNEIKLEEILERMK